MSDLVHVATGDASMADQVPVLSDVHKSVVRLLNAWGVELMIEIDFPPYRVDIYLPILHAAIEVDGPQHSAKRDRIRDSKLFALYSLPVFRIKATQALHPDHWRNRLVEFYGEFMDSAHERWEQCKDETPWL